MSKAIGPYHYEFIQGRGKGHEWRVGDQDDDVVTDFATEAQAKEYVRIHNLAVKRAKHPNWKE